MKKFILILNILFLCQFVCLADEPNDLGEVNGIIENLNRAAINLKNYSAKIDYTHSQPLFQTQTDRSGKVFYVKEANFAAVRINFTEMKQEDSPQQKYREDYIFDGWKMTKIDYQSKSAVSEVLAKDKPIEPFELVQDYFPIVGFAKPAEMAEQFDIKILGNKKDLIDLSLKPKQTSRFSKTYKEIEVKIDPKNYLPYEFSATTSEDEKIKIILSGIDTKSATKKDIFELVVPKDFTVSQQTPDSNN